MNQLALPIAELETGLDPLERFLRFHARHPDVYQRFRRLALLDLEAGETRLSARHIIETIRKETRPGSDDGRGPYRLNDHYAPYFARLLIGREPALFDGLFRTKKKCDIDTRSLLAAANRIDGVPSP